MSIEKNNRVGVVNGSDLLGPELTFGFEYASNDRAIVRHPFHGEITLGDQTAFSDAATDAAAVVLFQELPFLADAMKLSRTPTFETRPLAGQYSQLSHCFSLGVLAMQMGGSVMDVLEAFYNDASHRARGHSDDNFLQGPGRESQADMIRARFFERVGLVEALQSAGVLFGGANQVRGTKFFYGNEFLSHGMLSSRSTFVDNTHPSRPLDLDRFQYSLEEQLLFGVGSAVQEREIQSAIDRAQHTLGHIGRLVVAEEGDQLVSQDGEGLFRFAVEYARQNSEHWNEPVQDMLSSVMNFLDQYFFMCNAPAARRYQAFHPADYLHTSATLLERAYEEVAKEDGAFNWLWSWAKSTAAHLRTLSVQYDIDNNPYHGPKPPEGVSFVRMPQTDEKPAHIVRYNHENIEIVRPRGKVRRIQPRILRSNGSTQRLSEVYPQYERIIADQHQWIDDYVWRINVDADEGTKRELARACAFVEQNWQSALRRPEMSDAELRGYVSEANRFVLSRAA